MTLDVTTKDCSVLGDAELSEMADLTAGSADWEVGQLGKQADEWVLATIASRGRAIRGFVFVTLERIGGTPAMIVGAAATARDRSSSATLRAMMRDQYHRALMAFPDEDVLVSVRLAEPGGLEFLADLADVRPCPGVRVNGEERAWGRRLSKRYGALAFDDRTMLTRGVSPVLAADHWPAGRASDEVGDEATDHGEAFASCRPAEGEFVIAWGWALSEYLESFR